MTKLEENMRSKNMNLSKYACLDTDAFRLINISEDYRTPFFRDIDKIIYSLAFSRYKDKTQVFTYSVNDHLSKRSMHVIYVSKIARTIGRALNLNEDLIEAASLGHDLGHTPFGHAGEKIINEISLKNNEGYFNHNVESVRLLRFIENYGKGENITFQVLDAIMCHNGELVSNIYKPHKKTLDEFINEYNETFNDNTVIKKMIPSTLEGCVVRISDIISYIGRDIDDAIRMNLIEYSDVPKDIVEVLGSNNKDIVNTIVSDIIKNSIDKNYIKLSDNIFIAINKLLKFNYEFIYTRAISNDGLNEIKTMINTLFDTFMEDLISGNMESDINKSYLKNMSDEYKKNSNARIVIDYIAGMTDDYCKIEYNKIIKSIHTKKEV
ncbi:MAG: HD domain-containing protein [Bacilli bacterium]